MQLGQAYEAMTFVYVIAVPAMWSDKAQAELRKCAMAAGMGELSDIRIISEPETRLSMLFGQMVPTISWSMTQYSLDAGGGTVDLITFTIEQVSSALRLREPAAGTGAYCRSTLLTRRFEDFLRSRFESSPCWDSDTLEQAMSRLKPGPREDSRAQKR